MRYSSIVILSLLTSVLLTSCKVGPDYVKPPVVVPTKFKEATKNWKIAQPRDDCNRGPWWQIFNDQQLNTLEVQLTMANQTVAVAQAQYQQALALIDEARANYFPLITTALNITRQRQSSNGFITPGSSAVGISSSGTFNSHSLAFNASWEPDIWGGVRRSVESNIAAAQASAAAIGVARLSAQGTLAQSYFQLRALDQDQKLLDNTVVEYRQTLALTQNRYRAGVAGLSDVVQAKSQLETAQAQALNNGISRAQFEHAIAILIAQPPATLSKAQMPLTALPPQIPLQFPSTLLERRPDVAQAERQMAQANAQIGVAVAAYFPTLPLTAALSSQKRGLAQWFTLPPWSWVASAGVAETLIDGGLRDATVSAARASFEASIANYRQVVLAAYQNVEDNLVSLRILKAEAVVQNQAAANARLALKLVINQYKAGTVDYSAVITAQIAAFTAEKNAADITGLRMTAAVGLIKALGGGWNGEV